MLQIVILLTISGCVGVKFIVDLDDARKEYACCKQIGRYGREYDNDLSRVRKHEYDGGKERVKKHKNAVRVVNK